MASASQEDYLKAIYELSQEAITPIGARLSEELGVSAPAVTAAIKRLKRSGTVTTLKSGEIKLTEQGFSIAQRLVIRHNLVEKLLVDVLRMKWYEIHEEAERIEHAISPIVEKQLLVLFGDDASCPHGAPLRGDTVEDRRQAGLVLLSETSVTDTVEFHRIYEKDPEFLRYLDGLGIHPRARAQVQSVGYDHIINMKIGECSAHLGLPSTERIWVRVVSEDRGNGHG